MPRRTYKLSDETFKALSTFEAATAREMECDPSYIYKIKNGEESDPYPKFRELFRANAFAGGDYDCWLNDLLAIAVRAQKLHVCVSELSGKLLEKIETDADAMATLVKSLKDNHLDESECHEILSKLARKEATTQAIKNIVLHRLAAIKEEK